MSVRGRRLQRAQLAAQFAPIGDRQARAPARQRPATPRAISSASAPSRMRRAARPAPVRAAARSAEHDAGHAERRRADPRQIRARARLSSRKWPRRRSSTSRVSACSQPGDGQRQRDPDMRQKLHQAERQRQVRDHRGDRDLDRRRGSWCAKNAGRQHLDEHEGRQPGGIGGERRRGRRRLGRAERAALRTAPAGSAAPARSAPPPPAGSAAAPARRRGSASRPRPPTSPSRTWRDSGGRIAVPTAMPTTPSGSWFSRSA